MIFLKLLSPIIVLILSFVQFRINETQNPNNKKQKKLSKFFIILITLAIIFTIVTTILNEINSIKVTDKLNDLKKITIQADSTSSFRDSLAINDRKLLENKITDLQNKLDPFIIIAQNLYPELPIDNGLDNLKQEIEIIKNRTESLENFTSERKLSTVQISSIKQILSEEPKGKIIIGAVANNPEAYYFAQQIFDLFKNSNWDVKGISTTQYFSNPPKGIVIKVNNPDKIPHHFVTIERFLKIINTNITGQHNENVPIDTIEIIVGFKN